MQLGLERINPLGIGDFAASPPISHVEGVNGRAAFRADAREGNINFAAAETLQ